MSYSINFVFIKIVKCLYVIFIGNKFGRGGFLKVLMVLCYLRRRFCVVFDELFMLILRRIIIRFW